MYKWSTNYNIHPGNVQRCTSETQTTIYTQVMYSNVQVEHKTTINMQVINSNVQVKHKLQRMGKRKL